MDIHLLVGVIACQDYLDYNSAERQLSASGFDVALSWTVPCLHLEYLHFLVPEIQEHQIQLSFYFHHYDRQVVFLPPSEDKSIFI